MAERTRIARDLHDGLAQGFAAITLQVDRALTKLPGAPADVTRGLERARQLVSDSLAEARQTVWDLRAPALARGDFVSALRQRVEDPDAAVPARLAVHGQPEALPPAHETALLRIVQEALTNVARYARASRVEVELDFAPEAVTARVRGDGAGFTANADFSRGGHFGLAGMRERAEALGGTLMIESRPAAGATVTVRLPLASKRD